MKLHEQILDVLGEIDEDLLLDLTKKPLRTTAHRKFFRVSAAAAAVVLLAAGGFLLGRKVSQEIHITAPDFPTVIASDIIPRYLLEERSDYLSSSDQILTIAPLTGISLQPQIYTAEHTEDITLTDKMIFQLPR